MQSSYELVSQKTQIETVKIMILRKTRNHLEDSHLRRSPSLNFEEEQSHQTPQEFRQRQVIVSAYLRTTQKQKQNINADRKALFRKSNFQVNF